MCQKCCVCQFFSAQEKRKYPKKLSQGRTKIVCVYSFTIWLEVICQSFATKHRTKLESIWILCPFKKLSNLCFVYTILYLLNICFQLYIVHEGVIIEWPLKWQFHEAVTDVLMSQTDVSEMVDDDDDDEIPLGNVFYRYK